MIKQVTVTDLQRRAAEVISGLGEGPVVISQRGRPTAVIITAEVEAKQVREIVEAGLSSYRAGRTSSQATVARRLDQRGRRATDRHPLG